MYYMVSFGSTCLQDIDEYFYVQSIVRPGETISSREYKRRIGGKGVNQAVAVARAGGQVDFYGAIGTDGKWLTNEINEDGLNVGGIIVSNEPTGRALIQVANNGENSIVLLPGANYSQLYEERILEKIDGLHATHLLLQNEIHTRSTQYALENAHSVIIIVNPSPLPSPAEVDSFPWWKVDWLILNAGEAEGLYQAAIGQVDRTWSSKELLQSLASLGPFSKSSIVCTLGALGVMAVIPPVEQEGSRTLIHVPAARLQSNVCDTTGAGDCFTGYFVGELMQHGPGGLTKEAVEDMLKVAVQAAGICVERPGTIESIPHAREVKERMRDGK